MSTEERKQVCEGWVWIQPRGYSARLSWASKISSSDSISTARVGEGRVGWVRGGGQTSSASISPGLGRGVWGKRGWEGEGDG